MGYAIVGYFDKETDEKIRGLWKNLMLKEVDDYLYNSENNPHIKFAMYETLEEEQVIDVIRNIAEQTKTMNNEKQPNLRMALNDKIKQMKKQLQELEV